MPIYYDFISPPQRENGSAQRPQYPCFVNQGTVSLDDLIDLIGPKCDKATTLRVLTALEEAIAVEIRRGHRVRIDGLGSFFPHLEGRPVESTDDIHAQSIHVDSILFKADKALVDACQSDILRAPADKGRHTSADCPLDKQLVLLAQHFATQDELTTRQFVQLTGLSTAKARKALAYLTASEYLQQKGTRSATHYTPGNRL